MSEKDAAEVKMTDAHIVEIRDAHLPSQGESLDCIAFARAILAAGAPPPMSNAMEVAEVLRNYRCHHHRQDDDSGGMPLADVLTPAHGDGSIKLGLEEIEFLADEIADAIAQPEPDTVHLVEPVGTDLQTAPPFVPDQVRLALDHAEDWIAQEPHGDNCFLHDDGGEFDACFCGRDGALQAIELAFDVIGRTVPPAAADNEVGPTDKPVSESAPALPSAVSVQRSE